MAKKKTLTEYQDAFKLLVSEMEKDFGIPCNGVYIRVQVTTDWGNRDSITAYDVPKRTEKREVTCEISFGDSYGLKL